VDLIESLKYIRLPLCQVRSTSYMAVKRVLTTAYYCRLTNTRPAYFLMAGRVEREAWRTAEARSLKAGESIWSWVCATLTSISSS
jgi:hypothetical protein